MLSDPAEFIKMVEEEENQSIDIRELEAKRNLNDTLLKNLTAEYGRACQLYQKGFSYQGEGELDREEERLKGEKEKIQTDQDIV